MNDDGAVATELERNPRRRCDTLQIPAHACAAGEREHLDSLVPHHLLGKLVRARNDADGGRGRSGLEHDLRDRKGRERSLRRGPDDARVARGERGAELVGNEQHGSVERRDREHRPDRETPGPPVAALAARTGVDRDELTRRRDSPRLLAGTTEDLDGAVDFDPRLPDGEPRLQRHLARERFAPLLR